MASNTSPSGSRKRGRPPRSSASSCDESEPQSKISRRNDCSVESSHVTSSSAGVSRSRIGTIEKIVVKNFMCHSHLEFSFVPQVNFIIGRNGSGKSAVLTAIMAGLGGKASTTNRGSKISALIQKGRPSARVEVTLNNTGPEAYKENIFGPSITVVRTIRPVGGAYEIRDHERRLVSTKRDELQNILNHMNIQVDNPIVVLNQETSRNFLQSKSSKDKYVFFLKATQLETVKANYEEAEENAALASNLFDTKSAGLPHLERDVKKYGAILKFFDEIVDSKTKLKMLERECAWARVVAHEKDLAEATQRFEKTNGLCLELMKKLKSLEDNLDAAKGEMDRYENEMSKLERAKISIMSQLEDRKYSLEEEKKKYRKGDDEEKKIKRMIQSLESDKLSLENEIERAKNNSDEEWKKERDRRARDIVVIEEQFKSVRSQEVEAARKETSLRELMNKKDTEMREASIDLRRISDDCQRVFRQIQTTKAAKSDAVNRFGPKTADVLRAIAQEKRFRVKPKGPIGAFLQLRDERWAYAVERHCASTLGAFMVDNVDDAKLLKKIFEGFNLKNISTYTRKLNSKRYQCPVAASTDGSQNLIDVLEIKDADVFNLLVDTHTINQVSLFDNVEVALAKLKHAETVPKYCALAIDAEYNRVHPAPKYRILNNDRPIQVQLLKVDAKDRLPKLNADLKEMREDEAACDKQLKRIQKEVASLELDLRKAMDARSALRLEAGRCERKLRDLKDFEEPVAVNVSVLQDEVEKLSRDIEAKKGELPAVHENQQALLGQVREKNRALRAIEAVVKQYNEDIASLKNNLNKNEDKIQKIRDHVYSLSQKKAVLESTNESRLAEMNAKRSELNKVIASASKEFPERFETDRGEEALLLEIEALKDQISCMERTQPDPERTRKTFKLLKEKFETLSAELNNLKVYLSELKNLLRQRRETYIKVRDLACFRVNTVFQSLMASENFSACLVFEHGERKLQIDVKETSQSVRQSQRDVRGLSGGERSFSTVCFICALWSSTDHTPLRVLDEFDIFMDMSKRRKSLQMLLEICQKQARCQFIFLTPLEMPNIDALKDGSVKIQMMPEPDRGSIAAHGGMSTSTSR